jgi:hypothetical protein
MAMNDIAIMAAMRIERAISNDNTGIWETPADIITDIMYWAEQNGKTFADLLNTAQSYYDSDKVEELEENL